jgi:hypothetical protein
VRWHVITRGHLDQNSDQPGTPGQLGTGMFARRAATSRQFVAGISETRPFLNSTTPSHNANSV